jgi:hypothetical protein
MEGPQAKLALQVFCAGVTVQVLSIFIAMLVPARP